MMTNKEIPQPPKTERILSYMIVGIVGLSIIAMLVAMFLAPNYASGDRPLFISALAAIPLIGLPIGFVGILLLLFFNILRRRKQNSDG